MRDDDVNKHENILSLSWKFMSNSVNCVLHVYNNWAIRIMKRKMFHYCLLFENSNVDNFTVKIIFIISIQITCKFYFIFEGIFTWYYVSSCLWFYWELCICYSKSSIRLILTIFSAIIYYKSQMKSSAEV